MSETLKIVIPTAGWATRMRPQTWSKPKPLVSVAGKAAIDHLLQGFRTLPADIDVEYIIIVGPGLGEEQIPAYITEHHPDLRVRYVVQPQMLGQSDAFYSAREFLTGPLITIFSDTLIETDFSFLADEQNDGVAWVKPVEDARRFGVAELNGENCISRLIEKPTTNENTLAVVGCYFFQDGAALRSAFEEQFRLEKKYHNEYYLVDAINIMIERGAKMEIQKVETWLDTGTIEAILDTNHYLLEHGYGNSPETYGTDVQVISPVFIHPDAKISDSVIGPHVSIAGGCSLRNSKVQNSILEDGVCVEAAFLKDSFIGRNARVVGRSRDDPPMALNIGDDSTVIFKGESV